MRLIKVHDVGECMRTCWQPAGGGQLDGSTSALDLLHGCVQCHQVWCDNHQSFTPPTGMEYSGYKGEEDGA